MFGKVGSDLTAIDCEKSDNWLSSKSLEIGTGTKRVLSEIPTDKQQTTRLANRKRLKVMGGYMKDHVPVNNTILQDLQCLHPVVKKEGSDRSAISRLCSHLRKITMTDQFCDAVGSEWLLYASDSELDSLPCDAGVDISGYWKCISCMVDTAGEKKYKSLSFLAKAAMTLSHSNAVFGFLLTTP